DLAVGDAQVQAVQHRVAAERLLHVDELDGIRLGGLAARRALGVPAVLVVLVALAVLTFALRGLRLVRDARALADGRLRLLLRLLLPAQARRRVRRRRGHPGRLLS